ncbi:hypothetical protein DEO72_LG6g1635 [Vigna unguiculata]|uniref:Uncharacterized protein n=1 Tax=Vigna unguiculata TaxID=3917 RepID=A0A4D6M6Q6_VIGUN|nr:hypothetical protein DEO72_LG6g1635 [Vigna unguiculata]
MCQGRADSTTVEEKWRWVRVPELPRCCTNSCGYRCWCALVRGLLVIRGCFGEIQTRERGAVMVVAAGCTKKMTRWSSVVIDTSTNSDDSSGGYVSDDGRVEKTMQSQTTGVAAVTVFSGDSASWWLHSGVSNSGRTGS